MKKIAHPRLKGNSVNEIQAVLNQIVNSINELVEQSENIRGSASTSGSSENTIKVEKIDGKKYNVMFRTKDGWAEQEFNVKEK